MEHFSSDLFLEDIVEINLCFSVVGKEVFVVCRHSTFKNAQLNYPDQHILNEQAKFLRINVFEPRHH